LDFESEVPFIANVGEGAHRILPVDGTMEWEQMIVGKALVVLYMDRLQPLAQDGQILPVEATYEMGMSEIIAGPHVYRIIEGIDELDLFMDIRTIDVLVGGAFVFEVVLQGDTDTAFLGCGHMRCIISKVSFQ